MSADEDIGRVQRKDLFYPGIIIRRRASDVSHPHPETFALKMQVFRITDLQTFIIDITIHRTEGFEVLQRIGNRGISDIAAVPDLVARFKVAEDPAVEMAMRV